MTTGTDPLDVARIRKDFPILDREIDGRPIVYLDSANTRRSRGPSSTR